MGYHQLYLGIQTYLDQSITKRRRGDITNPHARKCGDAHQYEQNDTRLGASGIEDTRSGHDIQSSFREDSSDSESTNQEHDCR
jgi:hypothetical protein